MKFLLVILLLHFASANVIQNNEQNFAEIQEMVMNDEVNEDYDYENFNNFYNGFMDKNKFNNDTFEVRIVLYYVNGRYLIN